MEKAKMILSAIVMIAIGVVASVMGIKNISIMNQDPINLYDADLDWSTLEENKHVSTDINFMLDYFMFNSKVSYSNKNDKSRVYLLPDLGLVDGYLALTKFIGVSTASNYDQLDAVVKNTTLWWNDTTGECQLDKTFLVDGITREMTKEERDFLYQSLTKDYKYTAEEANSMIIPIVIDLKKGNNEIFPLIVGIIIGLIGVGMLVFSFVSNRKTKGGDAEIPAYTSMSTNNGPIYGTGAPYTNSGSAPSAPARPMTGPGSYDSEGSPDFGTFGMTNNARPANGTTQVANVFGQEQNAAQVPQNQNYGQTQAFVQAQNYGQAQQPEAPQPQNYGQTQQPAATQSQAQDNFGSFGRSTNEFMDFNSFKSSMNDSASQMENIPQIEVPPILEKNDDTSDNV